MSAGTPAVEALRRQTVRPLPGAATDTTPGNHFVSNYPPYSFWGREGLEEAERALDEAPVPGTPLGLYVHVPFCRRRCRFCYFKVYTDNRSSDVQRYLDAVLAEASRLLARPFVGGRRLHYVYVGGGTPSYLSSEQLRHLLGGLQALAPWDAAEEVAFECEPGTLSEVKLEALRELGVTRLSMGIESLDDRVLEANGRAHLSRHVREAYGWARAAGFPQINVDLIAGLVEESDESWAATVEGTLALEPDAVTIYPLELPFNTVVAREMKAAGLAVAPAAGWDAKRRRLKHAFARLEEEGYVLTSGYTAVRDPGRVRFVYRDSLWHGADMAALGVASFGHVGHTHVQNLKDLGAYLEAVEAGGLPLARALTLTDEESLIRELILQLKLGRVDARYFAEKFGVDVRERFAEPLAYFGERGFLRLEGDEVVLERDALVQVDGMLPAFYLPEHRGARYT